MTAVLVNDGLAAAVCAAEGRYVGRNPASEAAYREATASMPGGNTRTVLHYSPFPLRITGGDAVSVSDADGHSYMDFLGEFSAGLYGHRHPLIEAEIHGVLASGIALGGPNGYDAALADLLCARFPSIDQVRFCNSGTEANLFALLTARALTGRTHVLVFDGAYHGGCLAFDEHPSELNAPFPFLRGRYNDADRAAVLIERHASSLAAVIVEPMVNAGGCIPASREFLTALRQGCDRHGALLVFDEVVTSRLAPGGLQEQLDVLPDLTTLGKYLGGGLSFGAFGGRRDLMSRFDPRRADAFSHPGTFNNNVLSMAAGLTGLRHIFTPDAVTALNMRGDRLRQALNRLALEAAVPAQFTGVGSIMQLHFHRGEITAPNDIWVSDPDGRHDDLHKLYHLFMLENGVYVARRGSINLMLATADRDAELLLRAMSRFFGAFGDILSATVQ